MATSGTAILVADSDDDDGEIVVATVTAEQREAAARDAAVDLDDTSTGGAAAAVREAVPEAFSSDYTEELDAETEEAMRADYLKTQQVEQQPDRPAKRKRARVEIVSPAMQAASGSAAAAVAPPPATLLPVPQVKPEPAAARFTERSIGGVSISFPASIKPHAPQIAVMAKVVTALRLQKDALLEAPTGTGKSLALLSAALAWQAAEAKKLRAGGAAAAGGGDSRQAQALREKAGWNDRGGSGGGAEADTSAPSAPPKIFVCSRTHSQISQLLMELKRTPYEPEMTVLGSRTRFCCNTDAQNSTSSVDIACTQAVKAKTCSHHPKADSLAFQLSKLGVWDMGDMEDIRAEDGAGGGCPFFATRQLAEGASLIFAPYNYIFDPGVRAAMNIEVKDAAIIIDEGHNLEDVCREAASFEITATSLATVSREMVAMGKVSFRWKNPDS